MAWLEQTPSGNFLVAFRYGDQKFKKSLRTKSRQAAEGRLCRLEENIRLVENGRLVVPDEADIASFLLSDGQVNGKPKRRSSIRTLKHLWATSILYGQESSLHGVVFSKPPVG